MTKNSMSVHMHPAQTSPGRGIRLSIILVAVGLLAACTTGEPPERAEQTESKTESPAGSRTSPTATDDLGAKLCESVDIEVVQSVVGVRDIPDPPATPADTGSAWTCSWQGDAVSAGPNGQVVQPDVDVTLYRVPLDITEGGEVPTTVAGHAGTVRRAPGRCSIHVKGAERTLTVDAVAADRRDPCAATTSIAEPLVGRFVD